VYTSEYNWSRDMADGLQTFFHIWQLPFYLVPPSVQGNPEAEVVVTLLPGGEVLNVRIKKSSGNPAYDEAVERAVRRARPFEVPAGDAFQRNFREFTMAFRPVN
jgi:colicin import membrane protein